MKKEVIGYVLGVLFFIVLFIAQPFVVIWAINHVFSLGVAFTFKSWLAVHVLNFTWMFKGFPTVQKVHIQGDKDV